MPFADFGRLRAFNSSARAPLALTGGITLMPTALLHPNAAAPRGDRQGDLMNHPRLALFGLVLLLFAAGCSDGGLPTEPDHLDVALQAVVDGSNEGTEGFYFLPPMVRNPAYAGTFDPTLSPVVEICETTACLEFHQVFSMTEGAGSEVVRVDEAGEHYVVNWHTDRSGPAGTGTEVGQAYRIRVRVAGTLLGHADVQMAGNGKEARNPETDDVITLVDGRTLPIKFRVEEETVFVVGSDGGVFVSSDGAVKIELAQGAVDDEIGILVAPVTELLTDPDVVPGRAYEFLPSPYAFARPVILTIRYDPSTLPAGIPEEELRLLGFDGEEWVQLPGSSLDMEASTVSGPLESFSRKAVGRGKVHAVEVSPQDASIGVGETQQFAATVTNVDGEVMSRNVQWSSSDESVATIDNNGLVTAVTLGESTIEARAGRVSGSAALTVETPGPDVSRIEVSPATATIDVGATQQFTATVYDQYDEVMEGESIAWSSSDESVAGVDDAGLATALNDGATAIIAAIGEVSGQGDLNVEDPGPDPSVVDRLVVSPASATIETGETQQFAATAYDQFDAVMDVETVTWSSSHNTVATVDNAGLATGVGGGVVTIIASVGSTSGHATLTVTEKVSITPTIVPETITAGMHHSCGLDLQGNAFCWGDNQYGQLGDGTNTSSVVPVRVIMPDGVRFSSISAGSANNVALSETGLGYSWGANFSGQLGDGTITHRSVPTAVIMPAGATFAFVSMGTNHSVALGASGEAYGWGANFYGQVGDGTTSQRLIPVAVAMPIGASFASISAGSSHTVALSPTGTAYGWGFNGYGQLGDGTTTNRNTPVAVNMPEGVAFTFITGGSNNTMAITATNAAYGWGENLSGQLGDGTTSNKHMPVAVAMPSGVSFVSIGTGNGHAVALSATGEAYAWGFNSAGQLGDGTTTSRITPAAVIMPEGVAFTSVSQGGAGAQHYIALSSNGVAYGWGWNTTGQLGDGTTTNRSTPGPVVGEIIFQP